MKVKALVNLSYPRSQAVRNRIRRGDHLPHEERGEIVDVMWGEIVEAPADLLAGWLANGYVEVLAEEPQGGDVDG